VADLIVLGSGSETTVNDLPNEVEIRHCWIHGDPAVGSKRGIRANARKLTIRDSYMNDFKATSQETQAIAW
jgi:hypothetical protein